MTLVGVRDLRAGLATFLRRARAGERLLITVDGHPVAQLGPVNADPMGVSVTDLVARGALLAPRRRGDFIPAEPLALYSGARIDRALAQIRT